MKEFIEKEERKQMGMTFRKGQWKDFNRSQYTVLQRLISNPIHFSPDDTIPFEIATTSGVSFGVNI